MVQIDLTVSQSEQRALQRTHQQSDVNSGLVRVYLLSLALCLIKRQS